MKLSMWIIGNELVSKYETTSLIVNGDMVLESARVFPGDGIESMRNDLVYIGCSSDFFGETLSGKIIISAGADLIMVCSDDITEILNEVLNIFDKYRMFDEKLQHASTTQNPFEDMLSVIHSLFKCPMFFGQKDLRIYALTQQYTDAEVYPGWDDVKKLHTMPMTLVNSTVAPDMSKYPDSIQTVAIPVNENEGKHFKYQIRSNIYSNNKVWGHLYLYYYGTEVSISIIQLARYCADIYGTVLTRMENSQKIVKNNKYTFLIDLLDNLSVDANQLDALYWQMGWKKGDALRLYKIEFTQEIYSNTFFEYIFMTLERVSENEIVFPYKNCIVVIARDEEEKRGEPILTLNRISDKNMMRCGISYPFEDLQDLRLVYFQASFALSKIRFSKDIDSIFSYFDNYAFAGMIEYIRKNSEYKAFIAPQLFKLYKLDRSTGTEYYRTLFWLVVNNCRANETAKALFIHRNTLKYRIDKIMEMIKIDIYDSDIMAYIRFCYSLMMEDYPID